MLDVFIDMTNTAEGHFGNPDGGRCAIGSTLWEIGIPHDRLLRGSLLKGLSQADRNLVVEHFPMLFHYEAEIESWYDNMVNSLKHPSDLLKWSIQTSQLLRYYGRCAGINFIIASPLRSRRPRSKELTHESHDRTRSAAEGQRVRPGSACVCAKG